MHMYYATDVIFFIDSIQVSEGLGACLIMSSTFPSNTHLFIEMVNKLSCLLWIDLEMQSFRFRVLDSHSSSV